MKRHRLSVMSIATLTIAAFAAMLFVASCGSNTSSTTSSTASASAASGPAGMVPASIRQSGVLKVGTNIPGTPFEFYMPDNKTMTGADVELMDGLAKILDLKTEWTNISWDGLIPAETSGRVNTVISEMGDFTDRQQQVNFVDYLKGGTTLLIKKSDQGKFNKIEDLAGLTIGVTKGTSNLAVGNMLVEKLKSEGKTLTLLQFPGEGPGILALQSGRISGYLYDWVSGVYRANTQPGFATVFPNLMNKTFPYGMSTPKTADGMKLAQAFQAALNQMIANGSYKEIFSKYGMGDFLFQQAVINGGKTSSGG
jgi:polar amino acid transport system substrate-binding protein